MSEKEFNRDSIDSVISKILTNQESSEKLAEDRHKELLSVVNGHAEAIKQLQGFRYYVLGGAAMIGGVFSLIVEWIKEHVK